MAHLIDKDALVAEIKDMKGCKKSDWHFDEFDEGYKSALEDILSFINTLEVKEVDLESVFNNEYSKFSNNVDAEYAFPIDLADYKDFAKHFFDLGMAVSSKAQKGE